MVDVESALLDDAPKRDEHIKLQRDLLKTFLELLNKPRNDGTLTEFENLLQGRELKRLQYIYNSWKDKESALDNIPECRSFLSRSRLQEVLAKMLEKTATNREYLKLFIARFNAHNERIEAQYLPNRKARSSQGKQEIVRTLDTPLHCAVRQLDESFLDWLLGREPLEVNQRNHDKETALAMLCVLYDECKQRLKPQSNITNDQERLTERITTVESFIPKLLAKGADFNVYTCVPLPFDLLWKYAETDVVACSFIDRIRKLKPESIALTKRSSKDKVTDAVAGSEDETGQNTEGKRIARIRSVQLLPNTTEVRVTVELLEIFLRFNDIGQFQKYWETFQITHANVKSVIALLLHTAVDQSRTDCLKLIVEKAGNIIFRHGKDQKMEHRVELKGLLKKPCLMGKPYMLKIMLSYICDRLLLNEVPLLVTTLNKAHRAKGSKETKDLLSCAKVLIDNREKVPIHATGSDGNTALHLALKFGYNELALLLLEKQHGLVGLRNRQNRTPFDYGTRKFWEDYLDKCITMTNRPVLKVNVNFLRPLEKENPGKGTAKAQHFIQTICSRPCTWPDSWKILQPAKELRNPKCMFAHTVTEMTALRLIAQSKENNRLLMHPTLFSFIMLKWMLLRHWNFLNLLLTTLTILCFGAYTLTSSLALQILSGIGAISMMFREFTQLYLLGWSYVTLENVVDILTLVLTGVILSCGNTRGSICANVPICSSLVVVSMALQASFLLGLLSNKLATILNMFKTVSKSFFLSFLLFTPLIGSFVYGFYLTNNDAPTGEIDYCVADNCSEENFNNFRSFWNATIKTLVMTTGEFEAANVNFDGGKVLLFIGFLYLAPIVILNLINGLAVSDIAAIREESKLLSICKKVKQLERYERGIVKLLTFSETYKNRMLFSKPLFPRSFFEDYEPTIFIVTNESNKLGLVGKSGEKNSKISLKENDSTPPSIVNDSNTPFTIEDHCRTKKSTIDPIPVVPLLPKRCIDWYLNFRSTQIPLFLTLDKSYVDGAMTIVGKRFAASPGKDGEVLDFAEQSVTLTTKNSAEDSNKKVVKLSKSGTDPRDMQIKQLQKELYNVKQMQAKCKCQCGDQTRVEDHATGDHIALGHQGDR